MSDLATRAARCECHRALLEVEVARGRGVWVVVRRNVVSGEVRVGQVNNLVGVAVQHAAPFEPLGFIGDGTCQIIGVRSWYSVHGLYEVLYV